MKRRYKKRLVNYFFLCLIAFTIFPSFQIQGNIFPVIENNDVIQQQSQYIIFDQETSIEYNQPSSIVSPNVTVSNSAANMVNYQLDTKNDDNMIQQLQDQNLLYQFN